MIVSNQKSQQERNFTEQFSQAVDGLNLFSEQITKVRAEREEICNSYFGRASAYITPFAQETGNDSPLTLAQAVEGLKISIEQISSVINADITKYEQYKQQKTGLFDWTSF